MTLERSRTWSSPNLVRGVETIWNSDGTRYDEFRRSRTNVSQGTMHDELHSRKHLSKSKFGWMDWGGPMYSVSRRITTLDNFSLTSPKKGLYKKCTWDGYWHPATPAELQVQLVAPSTAMLDAWGTKAIARVIPTRPQSGLTQFVAELRDIPRMPIVGLYRAIKNGGRKKDLFRRSSRHIGGEYLNFEFGWRPLVADLIAFHKATRDASKHIAQLERDSGRVVRRKTTLYDNSTSTSWMSAGKSQIGFGPSTNVIRGADYVRYNRVDEESVWFSGAFTYYLTAGKDFVSSWKRDEQILSYLYGTRFSVDTLWELAPWSWAVDWVSSVGSVATNLAAFSNDGLVMRYGYVMFKRKVSTMAQMTCKIFNTDTLVSTHMKVEDELKMRRQATPFGFGLTIGGFSLRQVAILSALTLGKIGHSGH